MRSFWIVLDWILNNFFVYFFLSAFEVVLLHEIGKFVKHCLYLCLVVLRGCRYSLQGFQTVEVVLDFIINYQPVYISASYVVVVDVEIG